MTTLSKDTLIYLVEDDVAVRKAICRLLESLGFRVKVYSSANGFLKNGRELKSCLIVDIDLGGMSGIELHNYLIHLGVRIPVVFMSAHDEEGILRQVEQAGAPFLRKPIEAYLLIEAIRKAVESFK